MSEILSLLSLIGLFFLWIRVSHLTKQIDDLSKGAVSQEKPQQVPHVEIHATSSVSIQEKPEERVHTPSAVTRWITEDWLVKAGALLVLLGAGWFVTYAFAHQWIGPAGRVSLGLVFGSALMVLGIWRIRTHIHQGSLFTVLGSSIILLTTFAARYAYDFFDPTSALALMGASVVFVAYTSVSYKREILSVASIVLAGIAPFLTATPDPDVTGLFLYAFFVVLGTVWVVYYTGWIRPLIAAFGLVAIYSVPFLFTASGRDADTAFLFILVSTALFFVVNIFSMLVDSRKTSLGAVRYAHLIVALSTTVYLMIWIADAGVPEYRAFLYLAWMFVFALGSFVVYTRMHIRAPFYIYGAMSLALLAAATSEVFHGDTLVIAYTIEVAALTVVALLIDTRNTASGTPSSLVASVFWLWLIPIFLSLESIYSFSWREGVLHADCAVLLVLMLSSFVASMCISMRVQHISENAKHIGLILLLGSGVYALTLIWLVLHALLSADTATMFSLFVYSALGIALYVSGEIHEQKVRRYVGAVLLGGVIVRLLLVEVWSMPLAGRIITFFVIGLLLMSTAFIKRIKK